MRVLGAGLLALATLFAAIPATAGFGPPPLLDAAEMELALDAVANTGTVLYVAAHPDDENTAFLTWLENERHVRAAYLSMTRGDGGQNLLGQEKGDLLGVIRTQELLAARRIDHAEQFFTRAVDFGYSKNPEETLRTWGHDSTLADVVRIIRTLRPDVVVTRFPTTGEGGHGHHTASALLATEAFEAAGDPARFPEQLAEGLSAWRPRRLYWNTFSWGAPPSEADQRAQRLLRIDLGTFNPLLGRAANEVAAESRSMHKSQGFGSAERRGAQPNFFRPLAGDTAQTGAPLVDVLSGIDMTWNRWKVGHRVAQLLDQARGTFDPRDPAASLPVLLEADGELGRAAQSPEARPWRGLIEARRRELREIIRSAAGLWIEGIATRPALIPGDSIAVNAMLVNRSSAVVTLESVRLAHTDHRGELVAAGVVEKRPAKSLAANTPESVRLAAVVPADADWHLAQPYWLRLPSPAGRFQLESPALIARPENAPPYALTARLSIAGRPLEFTLPVLYRWTDRVRGEIYQPLTIGPAATLDFDEKVYLFPDAAPRPVKLRLAARDALKGVARLAAPPAWRVAPREIAVALAGGGVAAEVVFMVTPPAEAAPATLAAAFTAAGETFDHGVTTLDYPHIPIQTVYHPAEARALRLDLARRGERIGYVMGSGDEVPDALRQAGYSVALLSDDDLASGDLSSFDAVVIGVRAYNMRQALKQNNGRIVRYAQDGGTVVVQYQTTDDTLLPDFAPVRLKLSRDRVTVEEAPVALTDPADPLLNVPNKIGLADFDGWVQERGTYFGGEWDPAFRSPTECHDPGEPERKGGLLAAPVGKGLFIYTGYGFFRQLPAGVPGAYRLFVNLVSAGHRPAP